MGLLISRWQNSLLLRLGGMVAAITLLALLGMSTSWMVAKATQGNSEAINIAGSLRMQSWQMALLYTQQSRDPLEQAIHRFDHDLATETIQALLPADSNEPLQQSYRQIERHWQQTIKPALQEPPMTRPDLLERIPRFVDEINTLVKQMEQVTEAKIFGLQLILGAAIIGTLLTVLFSLYLMNAILVQPLNDLLALTNQLRQGHLTVRTDHAGEDEIGQLGRAFNRMAEDLARLYQSLEARVEQKTAELTRSNRSLDLLYRSISRLQSAPPNAATFQALLQETQMVVELGPSFICLKEASRERGEVVATTMNHHPCAEESDCNQCPLHHNTHSLVTDDGGLQLQIPLTDGEHHYGVLAVVIPDPSYADSWQVPLLESLSRHIGVTLASEKRMEQNRRLALLEERAVIARELHDSLAQSLAYMKIQVSRLRHALQRGDEIERGAALSELHEGLNSAYQQLRELLSTFRLRMDKADLKMALQQTVAEFTQRGGVPIAIDLQSDATNFTPNEEIHLLQIVREALSNVIKHAHAHQARVSLRSQKSGELLLQIEDDGIGMQRHAAQHHYGIAIMEERARALHGSLHYAVGAQGGTLVQLHFTPTQSCYAPREATTDAY